MREIRVKSVLNRHRKRDRWFLDEYSVNPYVGCGFNCIYCYVRGSKYGRSGFAAKVNAPEVLQRELRLRAKRREYGFIALSSATDPYQKVEEKFNLTRKLLDVIAEFRFPVHVMTKSGLILRDLELLKEVDGRARIPDDLRLRRGTIINISLPTLDWKIARVVEPSAPKPEKRLEILGKVKEEGFLAGISFIPVLPFISDSEEQLDEMVSAAKDGGADFVFVGTLTLFGNKPSDCRTLFFKFLESHFPDLLPKYRELYKLNEPPKEYQKMLEKRAARICEKYGVRMSIDNP